MVKSKHTRSWVGYEVGVASDLDRPIVVIEPAGRPVDLPVPGATVYLQRPPAVGAAKGQEWDVLLATAGNLRPYKVGEMPGGWQGVVSFLGEMFRMGKDESGAYESVQCRYQHCRSGFFVPESLYHLSRLPCPVCRTPFASLTVLAQELSEQVEKESAGRS
jgi:hypothetical protein